MSAHTWAGGITDTVFQHYLQILHRQLEGTEVMDNNQKDEGETHINNKIINNNEIHLPHDEYVPTPHQSTTEPRGLQPHGNSAFPIRIRHR